MKTVGIGHGSNSSKDGGVVSSNCKSCGNQSRHLAGHCLEKLKLGTFLGSTCAV